MSWFAKILSLIGIEGMTITLNGEEREGGYIFISSPELKGFSLLLEPGDYSDFKTFLDAVYSPLMIYMDAYQRASHSARRSENLRLRATKINEGGPMIAKMCFQ